MLKVLGLFFIVLGITLNISHKNSIKKANLTKKEKKELEKYKHNGNTFIFAGISALCLSFAFTIFN